MTDGRDQRGEGHNEGAGTNGRFQFHAQESSKDHQHHHTAARAYKAGAEADGQAPEDGHADFQCAELLIF